MTAIGLPMGPFEPPNELLQRPGSVLFWGEDPHLLALAAFGLARRINPEFGLLELAEPGRPEDFEPVFSIVPPDRRLRVTDDRQLLPDDAAANLALFSVVRSEGLTNDDARRLGDFLWLPPAFQEIVSRLRRAPGPAAIVLTHRELLVPKLEGHAAGFQRLLQLLAREEISVIATHLTDVPRMTLPTGSFDFVFRLARKPHRHWHESLLYAERSAAPMELPLALPIPARAFRPFEDACVAEAAAVARAQSQFRHWMVPE
jgi:hypothetical protein